MKKMRGFKMKYTAYHIDDTKLLNPIGQFDSRSKEGVFDLFYDENSSKTEGHYMVSNEKYDNGIDIIAVNHRGEQKKCHIEVERISRFKITPIKTKQSQ